MPRPLVLVDMLSYTGTKGGMETYTRELYREIGRMDTGFDFVALASQEGGRLDLSWFPGEVIRSRISGENRFVWAFGELVASSWYARRRRADLVHCPATLGPVRTSMPTVLTVHDMLYWSHPEFMVTPLLHAPRDVDGAARRRPTPRGSSPTARCPPRRSTSTSASRATGSTWCRWPPGHPDDGRAAERGRTSSSPAASAGPTRTGTRWCARWRWSTSRRPAAAGHHRGGPGRGPAGAGRGASTGMEEWVELKGWIEGDELADLRRRARAHGVPDARRGLRPARCSRRCRSACR